MSVTLCYMLLPLNIWLYRSVTLCYHHNLSGSYNLMSLFRLEPSLPKSTSRLPVLSAMYSSMYISIYLYALWPHSFYVARVVLQSLNCSWQSALYTSATIATLSTKGVLKSFQRNVAMLPSGSSRDLTYVTCVGRNPCRDLTRVIRVSRTPAWRSNIM